MLACTRAKEATKARAVVVGLLTIWQGWQNNELSLDSLLKSYWKNAKFVLNNSDEARTDLATFIGCKIRPYLS
ncbi:MAG: hypothetical protein YK1309IOTA_310005 [Marine Group I thaumarchaeote]|nr:MAG: hypothetical protein YK1309IOTA_310005 [Marine Group I thaumarchaeote]